MAPTADADEQGDDLRRAHGTERRRELEDCVERRCRATPTPTKAMATASPPVRGIGRLVDAPLVVGHVDGAERGAKRMESGVSTKLHGSGGDAARRGRRAVPRERLGSLLGQAGHREASADVADPAAQLLARDLVVALLDGAHDQLADLLASRPCRSRASSSPACRRGCPTTCWAAADRTGSRSC